MWDTVFPTNAHKAHQPPHAAVQAKSTNYKVRLAGCVANRSKDTDEVDRYCKVVSFNRLAHMPDLDAFRRSRLKKKTIFEMPDDQVVALPRAHGVRRRPRGRGCRSLPVGQAAIW